MRKIITAIAITTALSSYPAFSETDETADIFDLSLEELADIEITSFSKRSEKASEIAAAIHVITDEDIRRSGLTSIPELLRTVPGLQVAQAGAHDWAISARGFNAQFANKLLVLIDGRRVYNPLFSGVYWDVQDTLLDDVARIEVIRGPGGTIWGANAVNGIINIITKNAKDTQGGLAKAIVGTNEKGGAARYGGEIDENTFYKLYAKYKNNDEFKSSNRTNSDDEWSQWSSGFRVDSKLNDKSSLTVQGGGYSGSEESNLFLPSLTSPTLTQLVEDDFDVAGAHLLSKWNYVEDDGEQYSLQTYYDLTTRKTFPIEDQTHTFDLDFNHSLAKSTSQEWMWGLGYRFTRTDINSTPIINFSPEQRNDNLFTAFVQNKIALIEDELSLTLGSKFEHNDYTGFEWQPSARIAWLADEHNTFWAAVTKAVNTPNRAAHDNEIVVTATPLPTGGAGLVRQVGASSTNSEEVISYEAGYRVQPIENASIDVALFYNDYRSLFADSAGLPGLQVDSFYGPHVSIPFHVNTSASGQTYGLELSANWQATTKLLFTGSFSYIDMDLNGGSTFVSSENSTPEYQFNVSSRYSFENGIEWDNALYYVNELGSGSAIIPDYWRLDTRLGWEVHPGVELSLVGQNLLDSQHPEFGNFIYQNPVEVPRAVYGKVSWAF